jgi:hypothetical protein
MLGHKPGKTLKTPGDLPPSKLHSYFVTLVKPSVTGPTVSFPAFLTGKSACHAQSLAATNRVTEQLSWLAVESFFMSCSISWMASLIDTFIFWI